MNNDVLKKLVASLKRGACDEKWSYIDSLKSMANINNGKNDYQEFLDRYYYTPLRVILKNDDMVDKFRCGIEYNPRVGLTFSKRAFLKNLVANIDELLSYDEEKAFKEIKRAIRIKKDIYRDVYTNGKKSEFYDFVYNEFGTVKKKVKFDEYVKLCRQKYTRLLNGFVPLLDFLSKPIDVNKFISCFNVDQLYLLSCKSILNSTNNKNNKVIIDYVDLVNNIKEEKGYNVHITLRGNKYSISDLLKEVK